MAMLDLVGAVFGEKHIQVVADVTEGLAGFGGEFSESSTAIACGQFQQSLVEEVSLAGDDGKECGE